MKKIFLLIFLLAAQAVQPQNWREVEGAEIGVFSVGLNPLNKNSLWFGGFNKLFVSYDGGASAGRVIDLPTGGVVTNIFIIYSTARKHRHVKNY